jgi:hypothetical protein
MTCAGQWFSLGTPVSSINETDRHDTTEIINIVESDVKNHNSHSNKTFVSISLMEVKNIFHHFSSLYFK